MSDPVLPLAPRSAFAGLLRPGQSPSEAAPGLVVAPRSGLRLASVTARLGSRADLAEQVRQTCGLALPEGPRRTSAGRIAALGTGPRTWLFVEEEGAPDFARRLAAALGTSAAVCDQSDGYAVLRVAGPRARTVLAKGLAIDLHPRAFDPTCVAVTACAQVGVTLWQVDEAPSFELACPRSYAGSFAHWLAGSAAEFGCRIEPGA